MRVIEKWSLSPEQRDELWQMQHNKCCGCGRPIKRESARLDYNPKTYRARGWVCYLCSIISRAANDMDKFNQVIERLHKHPPADKFYAE